MQKNELTHAKKKIHTNLHAQYFLCMQTNINRNIELNPSLSKTKPITFYACKEIYIQT